MPNSSDFGPTIAESMAQLMLGSSRPAPVGVSGTPVCAPAHMPWMPDEMLLEILQHLLPKRRAYTISTSGDDLEFCPATLTSLLQTSTKLKYEVLRITKEYPIHINITSGNGCPCRSQGRSKAIMETASSLGKAARLPLWAGKEVIVTFTPMLHQKVTDECNVPLNVEGSSALRAMVHATGMRDFAYRDLCHSVQCLIRQSDALGSVMGEFARVQQQRYQTYSQFQFDGSMGVEKFEQDRPNSRIIWDLKAFRGALSSWRWTRSRDCAVPPVRLPTCLILGVDLTPNGYFDQGQHLPSATIERFWYEMATWWNYARPQYGRFIWNEDEVDRGFEEIYDSDFYLGPLRAGLGRRVLRQVPGAEFGGSPKEMVY
ncbi:hypothetical protein H2200_011699 [Cladophialophora chaetospira]|uniref:Uncharacterized protein n=1 Tax=Cladophialophora chaetospira TaxID=386627 RepID=A0AA38WYL2_9EURO|nr:hypothetical protein H2200_011699 [Cladophialophora chaetospira]